MNAIDACLPEFKSGLMPDPSMTLLEWADKFLYLPRESTAEYGKYRSNRTPMVREILEALSPTSPTQKVVVQKPTQLAGSTVGLIFMLGTADLFPGPGLMINVSGTLAKSFSKKKFTTTLKATMAGSGRLEGKIKDPRGRDSDNTMLEKAFPGGSWRMDGSNSPAVYRAESVRYIILDDFDGFDRNIGGEGDPADLADRRTGSFSNRKIYINSTPTVKGFSNIENEYNRSSQGLYNVPCPHCGGMQYLVFGDKEAEYGIKFEHDGPHVTEIYYMCIHCHGRIEERHKEFMLPRGEYVHKYPKRETLGFKYNALFTPLGWVNDWKKIAESLLSSKSNPEKLQVWMNTFMAETFEQKGARPEWVKLQARAEAYKITEVPAGGMLITCGVDVHDNRLDVAVRAWGRGEESWLIYWTRVYGDVATDDTWARLDDILAMSFKHSSGVEMRIISCAVDSGDNTQIVYNYCRKRGPVVMATYGSQKHNQPVLGRPARKDVSYKGSTLKNGIQIWPVGSDTAKSVIYGRFNLVEPGPGFYHFPIGLDDEYYQQITAEKLVATYNKKGFKQQQWHVVRGNRQNHALDAEVYCYAAAIRAGISRMNWNKKERNIQKRVEKMAAQENESAGVAEKPKQTRPQRRPRTRGGFVNGWKR